MGYSVIGMGQQKKAYANNTFSALAKDEAAINRANDQMEEQQRAQEMQTYGAIGGMAAEEGYRNFTATQEAAPVEELTVNSGATNSGTLAEGANGTITGTAQRGALEIGAEEAATQGALEATAETAATEAATTAAAETAAAEGAAAAAGEAAAATAAETAAATAATEAAATTAASTAGSAATTTAAAGAATVPVAGWLVAAGLLAYSLLG